MFFEMIPVKAAWDGYTASADEDVISLINFSNASEVAQTGAELSSDYTKGDALYSVYWRNQTSTQNLYFDVKQKDWTEYERIEMDIYSVAATGTEFIIVIETEERGDGYCYYNKKLNYDWVGWKKITIPLRDMTRTRSSDWAKVKRVRLTVDGWAMAPFSNQKSMFFYQSLNSKYTYSTIVRDVFLVRQDSDYEDFYVLSKPANKSQVFFQNSLKFLT